MSLDIYLTEAARKCPNCGIALTEPLSLEVFSANITHNLSAMAAEAGIYRHLWRPEEVPITKAHDLIEPLKAAIMAMEAEPGRFDRLNASNGWGTREQFLPWLETLLKACLEYPESEVRSSR